MSFLRKALLVNTTEFICLVLGIGQTVVLSRVLGPSGIGQYAVINSAMMLAVQVFAIGFPFSFLYHSQRDPEKTSEYLINTVYATVFLGIFGGIVLCTLVYYKAAYFGKVHWFVLLGLIFSVPITLQRVVTRNILLLKIQARRLSMMRIITILSSFLTILIFSFFGLLNVSLALICIIFASLTATVFGWSTTSDHLDFSKHPSFGLSLKLGFMGFRQSWVELMVVINAQISILIIKYLMDDFESVGYYSRGLRIAMLVVTTGQAIMPLLLSKWAAFPKEGLSRHVEKIMRVGGSFALIIIIGILLCGKWMIFLLYGKEYLPAVMPMMILLPGTVLYLLSNTLMVLLGGRGMPEVSAFFLFMSSAITAGLSFYLIPNGGIAGAALASTIGNIALLFGLILFVKRKFGVRARRCFFVTKNDFFSIKKELLRQKK